MTSPITSDLVEAYSLCPRKAFLLLTGAAADPGPHDYEMVLREQAEANRLSYRHWLAQAGEVFPLTGPPDLAAGKTVLAAVDLAADGLQARCDFLTRTSEPSRLGQHGYEPVTVIGTCRALKTDAIGLAYRGLVL